MGNHVEMRLEHAALISEAVRAAGLGAAWTVVAKLGGGLSTSTLYHIVVGGHRGGQRGVEAPAEQQYVVRLTAPDDAHNALVHEHAVMAAIDPLGIAPRLHYANAEQGIAITDFVAGQSFFPWTAERPPLLPTLASLVRTLHQGPALPRGDSIYDKANTVAGWLPPAFQAHTLVSGALSILRELETWVRDPDYLCPGHGDINPGNLLFDGTKLWLIDWAAAGQEHRYFDLACCTNFFCFRSKEMEDAFLAAYFERVLTAEEMTVYVHMRIFCGIYYGLIFLYMSGLQGTSPLPEEEIATLPDFAGFMQRLSNGEERLDDPVSQQRFGFIYLQRVQVQWETL